MVIIASLKLIIFVALITSYFLITSLFKITGLTSITKLIPATVSLYSKLLLKLLNIKTSSQGAGLKYNDSHYLIVSNHLSYVDILIISAQYPTYFITSMDIKNTPFLGEICKLASCIFVNRKSKNNRGQELHEINEKLMANNNVTVFPEATSTNGDRVKSFRWGLFQSAIETNCPILPITINYHSINGQKIDTANRDNIFWYGDMAFFSHFWNLLKSREVRCNMHISEPIYQPVRYKKHDLAGFCEGFVVKNFNAISCNKILTTNSL